LHKSKGNFLSNLLAPKVVSEPDPDTGLFNPFPSFTFTGPLRPVYPLSPRREVPKSIQHPDYWKDGIPHSEATFRGRNKIDILDKAGQDAMRKVCRLAREVLDIAAAAAVPGVTTDYIDEIVHKACLERDVGIFYTLDFYHANISSHILHHSTTVAFQNLSAPLPMKLSATEFQISECSLMATF
jgi:methionyl aminopeptidase